MNTTVTGLACPACASTQSFPLGFWDHIPMSVMGLPWREQDALEMGRHVLDVRRCAPCGHVYNARFDYTEVPYEDGSNLVYNRGHFWQVYQRELREHWIETFDLRDGCVVEVGAGEGRFLEAFGEAGNRCVAWEPGPDAERCRERGLEARREYFRGEHVVEVRPTAIVCRHVIEHLDDPGVLLRDIRRGCVEAGIRPYFLAEVPCIEKALEQNRIHDFLYEHVSNFTERSFRTLFERNGWRVLEVRTGYDGEVVSLAAVPRLRKTLRQDSTPVAGDAISEEFEQPSARFQRSVDRQVRAVRGRLLRWVGAGERVAMWGGTGKGAAMMNLFGIERAWLPRVVDSDLRKVGAFVPGTGQAIAAPQSLIDEPVDRILITTPWRARDIEHEIREVHGLTASLHVVHRGRIVELTPELEL